ncbi:hypothetical protein LCGC14_1187620 [marine sediment metagenome]|uniref:Uncharacterized protein n=1 Tax=marine sediment metagenome TaxID=412755 RepID=A0A0F9PQR3_9ZZZZ
MSRGLGTIPISSFKVKASKKVKRHFLESELATADDLVRDYADTVIEHTCEECGSSVDVVEDDTPLNRQKLIWLLERLQEEVL